MSWAYCVHNHCFRTCCRCKIRSPSENSLNLWCPKLVTGLLVTVALWLLSVMPLSSVFSQSNFSGLTSILIGEINGKSFILVLYMHNDTKIYLRLNRKSKWTSVNRQIVPHFTWNMAKRMFSKTRCYVGS